MKNRWMILLMLLFSARILMANGYREKYYAVLSHYQNVDKDSLKYKAALFLIDNMRGHECASGDGIASYISSLRSLKPKTDIGKLSRLWKDCHKGKSSQLVPDSVVVTDEYIISNVDDAFNMWKSSPWRGDVSFELFCKYILPYKVENESLSQEWRSKLRYQYKGILDGVKNVKEAYFRIYNEVMGRVVNSNGYTPYSLDVMSYDYMRRANCEQRCILLVSVLRAYGIPAAKDNVLYWADYSTKGHSWVSLPLLKSKTYCLIGGKVRLMCGGKDIDASHFLSSKEEAELKGLVKQVVKYKKAVSKIYRTEYERMGDGSDKYLSLAFRSDVSSQYGLKGSVVVNDIHYDKAYLCTFLTGWGWRPIAKADVIDNKAFFMGLGKNVVYLPVIDNGERIKALSAPFLLRKSNEVQYFSKISEDKETIIVQRKYPLCSYMPLQWKKLVGGVFEASDDSLFRKKTVLAKIDKIPVGQTEIQLNNGRKYRYVRFRNCNKEIGLLSELAFYATKDGKYKRLYGKYLSNKLDVNKVPFLFDEDLETKIKAYASDYWVGLELDSINRQVISKISFAPVSDGNDIQRGHLYELYGYDKTWKLIGRKFAKSNEKLVFSDVPRGMLLVLYDKTKGKEVRIFSYKRHKQIWF